MQYVPYIRPQENGGHADVRWLRLSDGAARTLRIALGRPAQVSATHFRASDLAAATHDVELAPRAETDRPPRRRAPRSRDRELRAGHAARIPGRPRDVPLELDADRLRRFNAVPIDWDPADRQFHLHNGAVSLVLRVFEDGTPRPAPPGRAASGRPVVPPPRARTRSPGSPTGSARRSRWPIPTSGTGDFRVPALVAAAADGATSLSLHYRDHRISRRQAGPRRPAVHLRRGPVRGGDARDHPRRRAVRASRSTSGSRSSPSRR